MYLDKNMFFFSSSGRIYSDATVAVRLLLATVPQEGGADEPYGGPSERPAARLQPVWSALREEMRLDEPSQSTRLRTGAR